MKERNEAVSKLSSQLKEVERLEAERQTLFSRIDGLERQKMGNNNVNNGVAASDMSKSLADANMKLKLEMGNVRSDHDRLLKQKEELSKDKAELTARLTETSVKLRERDTELKATAGKLADAQESAKSAKAQFDRAFEEAKKLRA